MEVLSNIFNLNILDIVKSMHISTLPTATSTERQTRGMKFFPVSPSRQNILGRWDGDRRSLRGCDASNDFLTGGMSP